MEYFYFSKGSKYFLRHCMEQTVQTVLPHSLHHSSFRWPKPPPPDEHLVKVRLTPFSLFFFWHFLKQHFHHTQSGSADCKAWAGHCKTNKKWTCTCVFPYGAQTPWYFSHFVDTCQPIKACRQWNAQTRSLGTLFTQIIVTCRIMSVRDWFGPHDRCNNIIPLLLHPVGQHHRTGLKTNLVFSADDVRLHHDTINERRRRRAGSLWGVYCGISFWDSQFENVGLRSIGTKAVLFCVLYSAVPPSCII